MAAFVPQIKECTVDVVGVIPQERVNRTHEHIVAVPVPQIMGETVEGGVLVQGDPTGAGVGTCREANRRCAFPARHGGGGSCDIDSSGALSTTTFWYHRSRSRVLK